MSKLDGNERWKSKMLLTEHVEQYEEARQPRTKAVPTAEELTMIRDYIMLPYMATMVERSAEDIERSKIMLSRLFAMAARAVLEDISGDIYEVKRELRKQNIRVMPYESDSTGAVITYEYICRGYKGEFSMVREHLKSQISIRLAEYVREIGASMRGVESHVIVPSTVQTYPGV